MRAFTTPRVAVLVLTALLMPVAVYAEAGAKDEYRATIDKTFPLKSGARFSLENKNGTVEFNTWDKEEVHIVAEKIMRTDSGGVSWLLRLVGLKEAVTTDEAALKLFDEFTINFTGDESGRTVTTTYPQTEGINFQVVYHITAPHRVVPTIETVNGRVEMKDVEGNTIVSTTNGSVSLATITGDVHASSTNGQLSIKDTSGAVNAETTNGAVNVVTRSGAPLSGAISLESTNGSVRVAVPANAAFELNLRTVNGSTSCALPLTTTQESSRKRLQGVVGAGGPVVALRTVNGSVRVETID